MVLLALVDADYCFTVADIGGYGRNSDRGILSHSTLGRRLASNQINVPSDQHIPGSLLDMAPMPFVIK